MKISISLEYYTRWGEAIYIEFTGRPPVRMNPVGSQWSIQLDDSSLTSGCEYMFTLRDSEGKLLRSEWRVHFLPQYQSSLSVLRIYDSWIDTPEDRPFLTAPFLESFCRHPATKKRSPVLGAHSIGFSVLSPLVAPGKVLAIAGSIPELGCWDPSRALRLDDSTFPIWNGATEVNHAINEFEYKFLILDRATGEIVSWEQRENRKAYIGHRTNDESVLINSLCYVNAPHPWHGAGVSIPVFSLRTENDWGVGDFLDLLTLVDWVAATGQRFIQVLPVNDTTMTGTWEDSYPYNANSTFALHPMYIRPEAAGLLPENRMSFYLAEKTELQALTDIDYVRVNKLKIAYLQELFDLKANEFTDDKKFGKFVSDNSYWLKPYASFCILRDKFSTPDHTYWEDFSTYNSEAIETLIRENRRDYDFICFLQFILDSQLRQARDYAHSKGVALKGDIPIGISRTSVDAWKEPAIFNLDASAGAPPDAFSTLGQNWGFPTYNWEEMAKDEFAWWKARFRKMAEYFDAYRIDHVLGFFRIWQIQRSNIHGLLGFFNSALPFTREELTGAYDFRPDPALLSQPFIADWFLNDLFGELVPVVVESFLIPLDQHHFKLRAEVSDQRKILEHFEALPSNEDNRIIRDGLMNLCDQVLFIEDPYHKGYYHPRIEGMSTFAFRNLCDYDKWLYTRLHDDFFYRRNDSFWREQGLWKLPAVTETTDMLPCAEDLGMIPACVPQVLNQLKILTLEIQRMPKDPAERFGNTFRYPYLSVCTTSTHDMPGIRGWWEENPELAERFYHDVLHGTGDAPKVADKWICKRIIELHLASPSMLCILPLQDWLSISSSLRRDNPSEEQINFPAMSRHYWRYRMHLTVEQLLSASEFNSELQALLSHSRRLD